MSVCGVTTLRRISVMFAVRSGSTAGRLVQEGGCLVLAGHRGNITVPFEITSDFCLCACGSIIVWNNIYDNYPGITACPHLS